MSDVATQNDSTKNDSTTPEDPFALVTDSKLAIEDVKVRDGFMSWIGDLSRKLKSAVVTEENSTKLLAWSESFLQSFCIADNGFPDWGGKYGMYQAFVIAPRNAAFQGATPTQVNKIRANVRQAKGRGGSNAPILLAIVRYCLTTDERFADIAEKLLDPKEGLKDKVLAEQAKNPSDELIAAVNAQYEVAVGAGEPPKTTKFRDVWNQSHGTGTGSGGDTADASRSDADNAARDVNRGVLAVGKVTPLTTATAIRDMLRGLVAQTVGEDKPIADRDKVRAILFETAANLSLYVKAIEAKTSEKEMRLLVDWAGTESEKTPEGEKVEGEKVEGEKVPAAQ